MFQWQELHPWKSRQLSVSSHHTAAGPVVNKYMKSVMHPCAEVAGSTHHSVLFSLLQAKDFRESRKRILGPMRLCSTVMLQLPLDEGHTVDKQM